MMDSGWFWLLVAMGVFWAVGAYRRLMGLRAQVNKQFAVLEDMMLGYQSLVQDATTAAVTKNVKASPMLWLMLHIP